MRAEEESSLGGYLGILCSAYMVGVLLVLPLYMKEGYWQLGDAKYFLYRNIAVICLVISVIISAAWFVAERDTGRFLWSWTDSFVLGYGVMCCVSYLLSDNRNLAWTGYEQWYMGLASQLLFVWSYFFISRWYDGGKFALWSGQAAFFTVTLLGILNRLKIDPIGVFAGMVTSDWEYTHLLSTIGNVNWLCGYLAVTIAFSVGGFLAAEKKIKRVIFYINSLLGLLLLCMQGSDTGLLVLGLGGVVLLCFAMGNEVICHRVLWMGVGMSLILPTFTGLCNWLDAWVTFPWDDRSHMILTWKGWIPVACFLFGMILLRKWLPFAKIRILVLVLTGAAALCVGIAMVPQVLGNMEWDYSWGNGRGGLWYLTLKGFLNGDFWQKCFGVGPDCFGVYLYNTFPVKQYVTLEGPFANTVFANAHNEWLNALVNIGVFGLTAYVGIFVSFLIRCGKRVSRDRWLCIGILGASLYAINGSFSFQEVLNAPFLFLLMGWCENRIRRSVTIERRTGESDEVEKMENRIDGGM